MKRYTVRGLSCASCAASVERAIRSLPAVSHVSVNFLTGSMEVEGDAEADEVMAAVRAAGYRAFPEEKPSGSSTDEYGACPAEMRGMLSRLIASVILCIPLMWISMGHMMWNWPLPAFAAESHMALGLCQMLLSLCVMFVNRAFFISGFKTLIHLSPDMNTLVATGSLAAFAYSLYSLAAMGTAASSGNPADATRHMGQLYFESSAMILTLVAVGKALETYSKGRTADALESLIRLSPQRATLIRDGEEVSVPVSKVRIGDIFIVRSGESIPADGVVTEGFGSVDESMLTGESVPADKEIGDCVYASTLHCAGFLECRVVKVGDETSFGRILQLVKNTSDSKAPIARTADRVSGIFVPVVMLAAVVTLFVWLMTGADFSFALSRAVSVLVISCPCALGLATPVAVMVGTGAAAKAGILFKNAASLEECGRVRTVVFDKTGTITDGYFEVTDLLPADGFDPDDLLWSACALEKMSAHPLGKAIVRYAERREGKSCKNYDPGTGMAMAGAEAAMATISVDAAKPRGGAGEASDFRIAPGGVSACIGSRIVRGGNQKYIGKETKIPQTYKARAEEFAAEGKSTLFFSLDGAFLGMIAVADAIKEESEGAVRYLKKMGIRVLMLTGDDEITARAVGVRAGIDEVIARILPDEKARIIMDLAGEDTVAMVGDGINDAPALGSANVGMAIGAGTDVAIDAADIVLMRSTPKDVPDAIRLSRKTLKNIRENFFWAFIYNVIGIPLAAGVWYHAFGLVLNPMIAAAAMSLSSICVVCNALRLNISGREIFRESSASGGRDADKGGSMEDSTMKKTLRIEGMMCPHCEANVREALEALPGVDEARVSHEAGTAVLSLSKDIDEAALRVAVDRCGKQGNFKLISAE